MKKTKLNPLGKVGRANKEARDKIAEIARQHNLTSCEIKLEGCMGTFGVAPAHKHRRGWYKGDVEKLSDYNEWVVGCNYCHEKIDADQGLLEETFNRLRA